MKRSMLYFCLMMLGTVFGSQPPQEEKKPENSLNWRVHLASIPLTFLNYYALTRLVVPASVRTHNFFRAAPVTSNIVFPWAVALGLILTPAFIGKFVPRFGLINPDELREAQRNALVYSSLYYMAPDALKSRVKSVPSALQKAFFKKTYHGISVKSFEQSQQKVPTIKGLTVEIKNDFEKLNKLEAAGGLDGKNFEEYRKIILDFSTSLVKRETAREDLYENYHIDKLSQLQSDATSLITKATQKDIDKKLFLSASKSLKELYAQIQGGALGLVGQALKYFEGEWP